MSYRDDDPAWAKSHALVVATLREQHELQVYMLQAFTEHPRGCGVDVLPRYAFAPVLARVQTYLGDAEPYVPVRAGAAQEYAEASALPVLRVQQLAAFPGGGYRIEGPAVAYLPESWMVAAVAALQLYGRAPASREDSIAVLRHLARPDADVDLYARLRDVWHVGGWPAVFAAAVSMPGSFAP